jgi:hypothetical protein
MSARPRASQAGQPAPVEPSERVQLARLALDAALGVDGVVSSDAGPLGTWVTADRGERLPGVVATALADGVYGVELHLVTEVVPLRPLAERVRSSVEQAVSSAGLAQLLGPVDITVEDVVLPNEVSKR